jgi:hypothetical protein
MTTAKDPSQWRSTYLNFSSDSAKKGRNSFTRSISEQSLNAGNSQGGAEAAAAIAFASNSISTAKYNILSL